VFLRDLEDFDVKKKKYNLSKEGMREGKVMACTVVVQEWKLVIGVSKRVGSSLHLRSFIYLFSYSVDLSSLSVGTFGGRTTLSFVRETSRVISRSIIFWAAACGA
jgi:hypothetical protein